MDELINAAAVDSIRRQSLNIPRHPSDWPPLVKFAVELILMERAIDRLQYSADRFTHLGATLLDRPIPTPVKRMLDEVVELYLWGFDRQSIAAACTCFELVVRQAFIAVGVATAAQYRRSPPSAENLRRELLRMELARNSAADVEFLIRTRNELLHKADSGDAPSRETTKRCIGALEGVINELHHAWPSTTRRKFPDEGS